MKRLSTCLLLPALLGVSATAARPDPTPVYLDKTASIEARVEDLLPRLSQDEKLSLLSGDRGFYIRPIPRLSLPEVKMADGPLGVRNWGNSTAYPATVGLAASWDTSLARDFGASVANDARARGVGIMLGPAVNIMRVPQNGRNFEYLSEDPYLAGAFATQIVLGMQSQGVVATVKHFAANNQETERGTIDEKISERALREIYLPAFRSAVEYGHAWAVMCAYNRINGVYCSADDWLNNKVLKGDWGFKGVLMSDWGAAHETLGVANGGLDLEMPSGLYMNAASLTPLIASGKVAQSTIDDKVRRILRLEIGAGFLDRPQTVDSTPKDDPRSAAVALRVARESVVLLKNDNSALPFTMRRMKSIVVVGPNAANYPTGGGSAHVEPFHTVSVLEGIRKVAGVRTKIHWISGPGPEMLESLLPTSAYEGPLKLEFITGDWGNRKVVATTTAAKIDADWKGESPAAGVEADKYSAAWSGTIKAPASGKYVFLVRNHGNVNVGIDGKEIIGSWSNPGDTLYAFRTLEAGKTYSIRVESHYDDRGPTAVQFAWGAAPPDLTNEDADLIRQADAVVFCAGFNLMLEGEGTDRTYDLPNDQPDFIQRVAALNPRTVVVVNSGGVVATASWIDSVPAVLQAWYPGQEGGTAVAEILAGIIDPSGKLPISYERARTDTPSYGNYPGMNGKVDYAEGIFVGYRWFDSKGVAPLYPFGYGLSYTTFAYQKLQVDAPDDNHWNVTFDVTNNGSRPGDEVSEVYISPPAGSKVVRPVRELKAFSRVSLAPDQSRTVTFLLDRSAFAYWDESKGAWAVEPGSYTIAVGSSSRNLQLTAPVDVTAGAP